MTAAMEPPRLFAWGRDGIPDEFEDYLNGLDTSVRMDRGEDVTGPRIVGFAAEGVKRAASDLLARLRADTAQFMDAKGHPPKLSHEMRTMVFLLHAYCAKWKMPAPAEVQWLTFESLGLKEGSPAPEVEVKIGSPKGINNMDEFLRAAAVDGEADAGGKQLTLYALAKKTEIPITTLRRWRDTAAYQQRRRFVAYVHAKV